MTSSLVACTEIDIQSDFSFVISVVMIGFNPATYSVREDAGSVSVTLSVQDGIQDRDVLVTLTTMNSTAMCESLKTLVDEYSVKLIYLYISHLSSWYGVYSSIN